MAWNRALQVDQAEMRLGGRSSPPEMKLAARDSGSSTALAGLGWAGFQSEAAGGAAAPAQHAAQALQYALWAADCGSALADASASAAVSS